MADTIIVGYDGSDNAAKALDVAVEFARMMPDSEIIITCAQNRPAPAVGFRGAEFGVEEMWDKLTKKIEEELDLAAARVRAAGVKVATACSPDRPDVTIVNIARETNARLIVMGTKGAGALQGEKSRLGSTTNRVLHEAGGIPVLVV